jgi:tetratricopeptide (TPR) repeat protein
MRAWDLATNRDCKFQRHNAFPLHAAISPDGALVASCAEEDTAYIWEATTGEVRCPLRHDKWVRYVAFNPDGSKVISASSDRTARIWDVTSGKEILPAPLKHADEVIEAKFSEDGKLVVTVSGDIARIWDAVTGKERTPPLKHKQRVRRAWFGPAGRGLLLTLTDNHAHLWHIATGEPITPPLEQFGALDAVFSPNGLGVITVGKGGALHRWDLSRDDRCAEDWVQLAQLISGYCLDPVQGLVPCALSPTELRACFDSLRSKHPNDFRCSQEILTAWRRQEAADAEKTSHWREARLHLDALLRDDHGQEELHSRRGYALAEMGQWKEAIADYKQVLRSNGDAEAWYRLGRAHFRLGEFKEALASYAKALRLDSSDGAVWLARSITYARLGNLNGAEDDYENAILRSPVNLPRVDCWWNDRRLRLKLPAPARWQAVSADCEAAITVEGFPWWALRSRGLALGTLGQWEAAAKDFRGATDLKPDDWRAWQGAARAFTEIGGRWVDAESALRQATRLKKYDWGCWYLLGVVSNRRSLNPEAISSYNEAIKYGAKGWGILAERGHAYLSNGNHDPAVMDFTAVILAYPHGTAYTSRAIAYKAKEDYDKAFTDCSDAIRLAPKSAFHRRNLGDLYRRTAQYEKALAEFNEAIRFSSQSEAALALAGRGDVYFSQGSYDKAVLDYTMALEHNRDYSYAYGRRGQAHAAVLNYDRAILDYSGALERTPNIKNNSNTRAIYYNSRGYAYERKGERDKAIEDYLAALNAQPDMMPPTLGLARLMVKEGKAQQVEELFRDRVHSSEKLVKDNPLNISHRQDLSSVYENLAVLLQLAGRLADAESACRQGLLLRQNLAKERPKDRFAWQNVALGHERLACILRDELRPREEVESYRAALTIRTKLALAAEFGRSAASKNSLAWLLATCPVGQLRDAEKAVELASEAVKLAPAAGTYWNTLGVAYYRAGKWQEGVEALRKSMALTSGGEVVDWLFLAMAHKQLGNHEEARQWYDKAVVHLEKDGVMDQGRRLFREEAAAVLGLPARAPTGKD